MNDKTLETALTWWARGFNVVLTPIGHGLKTRWARWQTERQRAQDVLDQAMSHPDYCNVALLTGYNNHLVIDCDSDQEYVQFVQKYTSLADTYTVRTGRGWHLHYICNDLPRVLPRRHELGFEIWGYGHFAQMAGSVHKSGSLYELVRDVNMMRVNLDALGLHSQPRKEKGNNGTFSFTRPKSAINSASICDQIKSQISILDILPDCNFVPSGNDHLMGYCPFHNDTDRSFAYYIKTNRAHCFSSNCSLGDAWHSVIDLYMIMHNCDLRAALSQLGRLV